VKKLKDLRIILIVVGIVFMFIFPIGFNDQYLIWVFSIALIYSVYASSWDLLSGYTGKENFGHAAFIAIGGYMVGFISKAFPIPVYLSLPISALVSAVFGVVIGIPTLRLKGPYFALATLAVASIFEKLTISMSQYTGGEEGMIGITYLTDDPNKSYYFLLIFAVLAVYTMFKISRSNFGLILKALKSDEDACRAIGINTTFYKVTAFALSASFAGMAGTLVAHNFGYIGPDIVYPLSLNSMIMAVVGGIGGIVPAALGGFFLTFVSELLRDFGDYNQIIYTLLLIFSALFLPNGVFNALSNFLKPKGLKGSTEIRGGK